MADTDAKPVAKKGVAHREYFRIRKNDGSPLEEAWTGIASTVALDAAAEGATTVTAQQIGTTSRGYVDLSSAETNADAVGLRISVTNANALITFIELNPEETGDIRVAATSWNGVPLGTTNPLPNAAPGAATGMIVSAAGGLDADGLAANVFDLHQALIPLPEVTISSAAANVLTLAADPGVDFTAGYAIVFDVSASRNAEIIETTSKVGTALTLKNTPTITIEDGVDRVLLIPTPTSQLEAADFGPNSLDGKGDWNTVVPDNAGITANGNAIAAKSSQASVDAVQSSVDTKSSQASVDAVQSSVDTKSSQASVDTLNQALIPLPEVTISSAAGSVLTLAADPGEDFTFGYAIVFDASNSRSAEVINTVSKVGTALTLDSAPTITIEDGVDTVLLLPAPVRPFEAADFAPNSLDGKGDWNTVAPDNAGITANGNAIAAKASQASVDAVQSSVDGLAVGVSTRCRIATAAAYEHPEAGSVAYSVQILCVDESGVLVAADSTPTLAVTNVLGTDRSGNLSAITNPATGRYVATYTVTNGDTLEPLIVTATAVIGGETFVGVTLPVVTDAVATDFTTTDRNNLVAALADTDELQTDLVDGGRLDLLFDAIKAVTDNLPDSGALTTIETLLRLAASGAVGSVGITDNGATLTLSFKDTDGTTEIANTTYTKLTGARTRNS